GVPITFRVGPDGALYYGVFSFATTNPIGRVARVSPKAPIACLPDAGVMPGVDGGGGGTGDGGGGGGGDGGGDGGGGGGDDGGCGCQVGGRTDVAAAAGAALLLLGLGIWLSRRRVRAGAKRR
ncbi:MAG TPA: MYXO-CTERM sorting domain-containing protein, partial [Gemmatimonadales bacterium]|nr:MYXO-CTERM sorting domain-containing protein [Gemmatimonadales bacterium]